MIVKKKILLTSQIFLLAVTWLGVPAASLNIWPVISSRDCPLGYVLHIDNQCMKPIITRRFFLFDLPRETSKPWNYPSSYKIFQANPQYTHGNHIYRSPVGTAYKPRNTVVIPANIIRSDHNTINQIPIDHQNNMQILRNLYSFGENRVVPLKSTNLRPNTNDLRWQNSISASIHSLPNYRNTYY